MLALALALPISIPFAGAARVPTSLATVPHFTNLTDELGLGAPLTALSPAEVTAEDNQGFLNGGKGGAWFDYNLDGWPDLLIAGFNHRELHRNNGDGTFTDVTDAAKIGGHMYTMSVITPDLNNDGFPDVVFGNWYERCEIFLNNGDGTFRNVTSPWNFFVVGPTSGLSFGDLDGDGWGDLYIGSYYKRQSLIFHNLNGQGLEDVTKRAGIADPQGFTFQVLMFDYNQDGLLDLYDVNDFGPDTLFQNHGNFNFTDVSVAAGVAVKGDGMGGALGDINGDGYMDVFVTNFGDDDLLVYDPANKTFVEDYLWRGFFDMGVGWGVNIEDFNNDGYLDVFVADGRVVTGQSDEADKLWINQGNGTFVDGAAEAGVQDLGINRGSAAADWNRDGQMDLWVANVVANSSVYRNEGNANHWLEVRLEGVVSVRDAVGAKLTLTAGGRNQTRVVHMGDSYLSQSSLVQHFGLGNATSATTLTVDWPSGVRQVFNNVAADQVLRVQEYEGNPPSARMADVVGDAGTELFFNASASTDDTKIVSWSWSFGAPYAWVSLGGRDPGFTFYDPTNFTGTLTLTDAFGNVNATTFNVTIRPSGHPLVYAGPDLQAAQNATLLFSATLKGGPTYDDYANVTFAWRVDGPGGAVNLTGRNISRTFADPGVYLVTVFATDLFGQSGNDSLTVVVGDNEPPVIVLQPPDAVPEDTSFSLDASQTHDNDPSFATTGLFYWRVQAAGGQFEVHTGPVAQFRLDNPGPAQFTLEVNDSSGNLATRSFVIDATDGTPPVAQGGGDRVTVAGATVTLSAAASTDNDPAFFTRGTFEWNFVGPDGVGRALGVVASLTLLSPGVTHVRLHVVDPSGNEALQEDAFNITALDRTAPSLSAMADLRVGFGTPTLLVAPLATDNDPSFAATAHYHWTVADGTALLSFEGPQVNYTFTQVGRWPVQLTVTDGAGNSARQNFTVSVADVTAPRLVAVVPAGATVGVPATLNAENSTDDVGIASFAWAIDGPSASVTLNGRFLRWTFQDPGNYTITLTLTDAAGNAVSQVFDLTVEAAPAPPPPNPGPSGGANATAPPPQGNGALLLAAGGVAAAAVAAVMVVRLRRRAQP